ncbi:MAG: MBL fold metallo-hydrolase [Chloroflexi bacterium]|nr:MAG: MBL fold metallo-hydrolase [Chloroflexota bacterium]
MSLEIKMLTLGPIGTNSYIIGDTNSGKAIVIDPVDDAPLLQQTAQEAGWEIALILATHGHFDHVLASKALKELTGAPFWAHHRAPEWLERLPEQGQMFFGKPFPEAAIPDRLLGDENEEIAIGDIQLKTLYTPGHSQDHIAYYCPDAGVVFAGDCLFAGSIGRTDLPGGNYDQLMQSITEKLLPLGDDTQVLPGHMQITTIGQERRSNPFLLSYMTS